MRSKDPVLECRLVTAKGTASLTFVKPDNEQDYILVIQGVDEQGRWGYYYEYLDHITPKP